MSESRRRMCVFNVLSDVLSDYNNPFGDEGLAALVAPPPPAGTPPRPAGGLKKLELLSTSTAPSQVTDAGCAKLAAWLESGAMPALEVLELDDILASAEARAARYSLGKKYPGGVTRNNWKFQWA